MTAATAETAIPSAAVPAYFTGSKWAFMIVVMALTNFMEVLDLSIANVSLNSISGSLGVSPNQGTWVITSYAVANAIAVPLTAWMGQRFGQVRLFVTATALFTFTSWICGMSTSLEMLIAARVAQGVVAGFMIPLSQAIMLNNSPPEKRMMALATWSMTVTAGPVVGPLLGGWITDNYHWAWIFFINIPAGIFAVIVTWNLLKDRETAIKKGPVDMIGLALLVLWVGSLQIMLDKGNELDWFENRFIVALALIAFLGFCFFLVWELTEANPVVDLSLFRYRNFSAGLTVLGLGYGVFFGNVVLLPLLLQTQLGFTATWSGRITAPLGIFAVLCSPIVGKLMSKSDPRRFATLGVMIFAACSFWRTGLTSTADVESYLLPQLFQGIGLACFFAPLISINTGGMPASKMASASGTQNFMRMMLGSFGTSVIVTFWDHRAALHRTQLVEALPADGSRITDGLNALSQAGVGTAESYAQIDRLLGVESFMLAANDMFWLSGVVFVCLIGIIWIAKPPFGGGGAAH